MRTPIRMLTIVSYVAVSAFALSACNTAEGFGKDVKQTGEKIEDKAKDSK